MNVTGRKGKVQCIIAKWGMEIIITINLVALWFSRLLLSNSELFVPFWWASLLILGELLGALGVRKEGGVRDGG